MITDRDIWRTAWDMIQEFSGEAYIHAAIKADDRLAEGDIYGQHVWMSVLNAINQIRRTLPVEGERLN